MAVLDMRDNLSKMLKASSVLMHSINNSILKNKKYMPCYKNLKIHVSKHNKFVFKTLNKLTLGTNAPFTPASQEFSVSWKLLYHFKQLVQTS